MSRKAHKNSSGSSNRRAVPSVGGVFGEGVITELIAGQGPAAQPQFLAFDGTQKKITRRFDHDGVSYVPVQLDATIARAIRLPADAIAYGSTRKLFVEVAHQISRVTHLPENLVTLITFFVFATWLADCVPVPPGVWIIAPPTASIAPLEQLFGLLCRRVLFVSQPALDGLRSLPMHLKPTIMMEVPTVSRSLLKVLAASNRPGAYTAARGKLFDFSCAKIVFATQPLRDPAAAGFPLEIALAPISERVTLFGREEADRIAAEFQAKFLFYRLTHYRNVPTPSIDLAGFTAPTQELAHTLVSCIVDDNKLQAELVPLLSQRDREIRIDRTLLLECMVLEALLDACHEMESGILSIGELTQTVNTILVGRCGHGEVSPETVGWKLRALGLRTESITGGRKGLVLLEETRKMIHKLAAEYGVRTLLRGPVNSECRHCAALGLASNEGAGQFGTKTQVAGGR